MNEGLELLERSVMAMLLAGDDATATILNGQYKQSAVVDRAFTGVGFFTTFAVPPTATALTGCPSLKFGNVAAQIEGLKYGAGFVLHVLEGRLECLECYTYDEPWPIIIPRFRLFYPTGSATDIEELRKEWA